MATPLNRLFLHFFDLHYLKHAATRANPRAVLEEAELAVRIAVLSANEVYVAASSFFESPLCAQVLNGLSDLFETGVITLIGGEDTILDFAASKLDTYDEGGDQHARYSAALLSDEPLPAFRRRMHSATQDIRAAWLNFAATPDELSKLFETAPVTVNAALVDRWSEVPELLGGRAFTPEYVSPLILPGDANRLGHSRVASVINREYFSSYSNELRAGFVCDLVSMSSGYKLDNRYGNVSYRTALQHLREAGLVEQILDASAADLLQLRSDPGIVQALARAMTGVPPAIVLDTRLDVLLDVSDTVAKLASIPTGKDHATVYQKAVATILDNVFGASLGDGHLETKMNEGRKRLDITWRNDQVMGFFSWVHANYFAPFVFGECKNYKRDVENAEIDQLLGRLSPRTTKFGLLLCRKAVNRTLLTQRCRDAYRLEQGLVIILDDADVVELNAMDRDPDWGKQQSKFMYERVRDVVL